MAEGTSFEQRFDETKWTWLGEPRRLQVFGWQRSLWRYDCSLIVPKEWKHIFQTHFWRYLRRHIRRWHECERLLQRSNDGTTWHAHLLSHKPSMDDKDTFPYQSLLRWREIQRLEDDRHNAKPNRCNPIVLNSLSLEEPWLRTIE